MKAEWQLTPCGRYEIRETVYETLTKHGKPQIYRVREARLAPGQKDRNQMVSGPTARREDVLAERDDAG